MRKIILFFLALLIISGVLFYRNYHKEKILSVRQNDTQSEMNIVFGIDENFVMPASVTITSLLKNNPDRRIHIHLIGENLSKESQYKLKHLISIFPQAKIDFYETVVPDSFKNLLFFNRISKATFLRFYLIKLLPKTVDKVLYLDADIIITDSLSDFYDTNLDKAFVMGVAEDTDYHLTRLANYHIKHYINAGVLLLNLKALRQQFNFEDLISFIQDNTDNPAIKHADQDIINILWQDKMLFAQDIYNVPRHYPFDKYGIILHYWGPDKPWDKHYKNMFTYWKQIPWKIYHGMYQNYMNQNNPWISSYYQTLLDIFPERLPAFYKRWVNEPILSFVSRLIY